MAFNLGVSNNNGKLHFSDFLGSETTSVQNTEKEISVDLLVPWENQPFKMYDDFKLNELAESIKENGLLSRIIVCPIDDGKYRIIAGHNRVAACKLAGMSDIPSIIKNVDENRAKLIMADTNLCQRTELLPSERAYAYKAQQEALIALGSPRATAEIAEKYGECKRTIQRYISCSRLIPKLMDMLDNNSLSLQTGVIFSGMPVPSQKEIADYLDEDKAHCISFEQAKELAERNLITKADILEVVEGIKQKKADSESEEESENAAPESKAETAKKTEEKSAKNITLKRKEVIEIIGDELSNDEISEYFYFCLQKSELLNEWRSLYSGNTEVEEQLDEDEENFFDEM